MEKLKEFVRAIEELERELEAGAAAGWQERVLFWRDAAGERRDAAESFEELNSWQALYRRAARLYAAGKRLKAD